MNAEAFNAAVDFRAARPHRGNTKGNKLHPQPITLAEAQQLLEACRPLKSAKNLRSRAIVVVLYRGMLRANEAVHLQLADFDQASGELRVLVAKGGKARVVALDEKAAGIVGDWIKRRELLGIGAGPLLCTLQRRGRGKRLATCYLRELIATTARKAGIGKRVHPHGLRHSGACELLKAGVSIGIISKALGHSSIATTARYLDHISPVDVLAAMRGMQW